MKILFIFVDGLGLGCDDPAVNPLRDTRYPVLQRLLDNSTPLDACLGTEGLPQSATGQASLLTGVNAAKAMGRHIEGFPPTSLKKLIEHENIFGKLMKQGKRCTFANSYWIDDPHRIPLRRQSVTTVMSLAALHAVRGKQELMDGKAVCHDITRWTMHTRGYEGELITPETAAVHLLNVAEENDFTLFEYFLTDRAGHTGSAEEASHTLTPLDRFLAEVTSLCEASGILLLLSSDHGNIEDLSIRTHTRNPVPLIAIGPGAEAFGSLKDLTEVTPKIVRFLSGPR